MELISPIGRKKLIKNRLAFTHLPVGLHLIMVPLKYRNKQNFYLQRLSLVARLPGYKRWSKI